MLNTRHTENAISHKFLFIHLGDVIPFMGEYSYCTIQIHVLFCDVMYLWDTLLKYLWSWAIFTCPQM